MKKATRRHVVLSLLFIAIFTAINLAWHLRDPITRTIIDVWNQGPRQYEPVVVYDDENERNATVAVPMHVQHVVTDHGNGSVVETAVAWRNNRLRILCVGDSVTVGYRSSTGNGYREELKKHLEDGENELFFAGSAFGGQMEDGYFAAWNGRTIQYMSDHVNASLVHRPNVVLLHAGTNDMNNDPNRSVEGNDPVEAANRLGHLIDQILEACPDAVVLVAVIINSCIAGQRERVQQYQALIPGVVHSRLLEGKHVLAVDFSELGDKILLNDCVHPSDSGYRAMGKWWYDYITQIPEFWLDAPLGEDPERPERTDLNAAVRDRPWWIKLSVVVMLWAVLSWS